MIRSMYSDFFAFAFIVYFIMENYTDIKKINKNFCAWGILFLVIGMLLYIIGTRASYEYLTNLSLPIFYIWVSHYHCMEGDCSLNY